MFLLVFVRWLRGTVTFLITGAFPERLINVCLKNGLPVWGIKHLPEGIEANAYASDYRRLRPLVKQTGTRIKLSKKTGLYVYRHRYRRRKVLFFSFICAAVVLFVSSQFVWQVDINGCITIPEEELRAELTELGVKPGIWAASIDARDLQQRLILMDNRIAWIAINIVGSTAQIELREREIPPAPKDPDDRAANVVADCDGQIRYIEVYEGQTVVKKGDTVSKGDIIVSGIMEDQYGNRQFKYARAKILAHTYEEHQVEVPLNQPQWVVSGVPMMRRYLVCNNWRVPLFLSLKSEKHAFSLVEERKGLLSVPKVTLVNVMATPVTLEIATVTEHQAKEFAMRQLSELHKDSPEVKVISREIEGQCENGIYYLTERTLVEKDIARQVEILK